MTALKKNNPKRLKAHTVMLNLLKMLVAFGSMENLHLTENLPVLMLHLTTRHTVVFCASVFHSFVLFLFCVFWVAPYSK